MSENAASEACSGVFDSLMRQGESLNSENLSEILLLIESLHVFPAFQRGEIQSEFEEFLQHNTITNSADFIKQLTQILSHHQNEEDPSRVVPSAMNESSYMLNGSQNNISIDKVIPPLIPISDIVSDHGDEEEFVSSAQVEVRRTEIRGGFTMFLIDDGKLSLENGSEKNLRENNNNNNNDGFEDSVSSSNRRKGTPAANSSHSAAALMSRQISKAQFLVEDGDINSNDDDEIDSIKQENDDGRENENVAVNLEANKIGIASSSSAQNSRLQSQVKLSSSPSQMLQIPNSDDVSAAIAIVPRVSSLIIAPNEETKKSASSLVTSQRDGRSRKRSQLRVDFGQEDVVISDKQLQSQPHLQKKSHNSNNNPSRSGENENKEESLDHWMSRGGQNFFSSSNLQSIQLPEVQLNSNPIVAAAGAPPMNIVLNSHSSSSSGGSSGRSKRKSRSSKNNLYNNNNEFDDLEDHIKGDPISPTRRAFQSSRDSNKSNHKSNCEVLRDFKAKHTDLIVDVFCKYSKLGTEGSPELSNAGNSRDHPHVFDVVEKKENKVQVLNFSALLTELFKEKVWIFLHKLDIEEFHQKSDGYSRLFEAFDNYFTAQAAQTAGNNDDQNEFNLTESMFTSDQFFEVLEFWSSKDPQLYISTVPPKFQDINEQEELEYRSSVSQASSQQAVENMAKQRSQQRINKKEKEVSNEKTNSDNEEKSELEIQVARAKYQNLLSEADSEIERKLIEKVLADLNEQLNQLKKSKKDRFLEKKQKQIAAQLAGSGLELEPAAAAAAEISNQSAPQPTIEHSDLKRPTKTGASPAKYVSPQEKREKNLLVLYRFYCKQSFVSGKHDTFDRVMIETNVMNMGKFFLFVRDFAIVDKFTKKEKIVEMYKKCSLDSKNLTFDEFKFMLSRLAELRESVRQPIEKKPHHGVSSNQGSPTHTPPPVAAAITVEPSESLESFYTFLGIDDPEKLKEKTKNPNLQIGISAKQAAERQQQNANSNSGSNSNNPTTSGSNSRAIPLRLASRLVELSSKNKRDSKEISLPKQSSKQSTGSSSSIDLPPIRATKKLSAKKPKQQFELEKVYGPTECTWESLQSNKFSELRFLNQSDFKPTDLFDANSPEDDEYLAQYMLNESEIERAKKTERIRLLSTYGEIRVNPNRRESSSHSNSHQINRPTSNTRVLLDASHSSESSPPQQQLLHHKLHSQLNSQYSQLQQQYLPTDKYDPGSEQRWRSMSGYFEGENGISRVPRYPHAQDATYPLRANDKSGLMMMNQMQLNNLDPMQFGGMYDQQQSQSHQLSQKSVATAAVAAGMYNNSNNNVHHPQSQLQLMMTPEKVLKTPLASVANAIGSSGGNGGGNVRVLNQRNSRVNRSFTLQQSQQPNAQIGYQQSPKMQQMINIPSPYGQPQQQSLLTNNDVHVSEKQLLFPGKTNTMAERQRKIVQNSRNRIAEIENEIKLKQQEEMVIALQKNQNNVQQSQKLAKLRAKRADDRQQLHPQITSERRSGQFRQ